MGKYVKKGAPPKSTLEQALTQAEDEHYLDCPNAEPWLRLSTFVLDAIFLGLLQHGTERIFGLVLKRLAENPQGFAFNLARASEIATYALIIHLFCIFCTSRFGGSPAKLIFGLRVVHQNTGELLSAGQALFREIARFGLAVATAGLSWGVAWLRPDRLAWHDLISRSVVKRVRH